MGAKPAWAFNRKPAASEMQCKSGCSIESFEPESQVCCLLGASRANEGLSSTSD